MTALDWSRYPNFSAAEMACRHCGECRVEPEFMDALQKLRAHLGFPFIISSGYRCPIHNMTISQTGAGGPHTTGRAADIAIFGERAWRLLQALPPTFTGIGVKQHGPAVGRFIHLDILLGASRPAIWSYQ